MKDLRFLLIIWSMLFLAACSKKITGLAQSAQIKVMSYNIHHCNPPSKPDFIDLDAIVNAIAKENPDVVALQEVDVNTKRNGKVDQAKQLAAKLKMNVFFAKAIDHDEGDYGVAILSKFKMQDSKIIRLTTKPETKSEPRVLATTILVLPNGKRVKFGCTHLDAQRDETNRLLQTREIAEIGKSDNMPFIIAGDWNAKPGSDPVKIMDEAFTRTCSNCEFTIPVINPRSTIDFIAYGKGNSFEVISHQVIPERYASDHLPIVSVLKLKGN
ncbi:endonuclease/exonuclease/phosphatase family protein [Mucilaginibacter aquatilis]|nr:endonuclease/exonuclease/phosphatase family protein [Mucilaginibacter aquatilis]